MATKRTINRWCHLRFKKTSGKGKPRRNGIIGQPLINWISVLVILNFFFINGFNITSQSLIHIVTSLKNENPSIDQVQLRGTNLENLAKQVPSLSKYDLKNSFYFMNSQMWPTHDESAFINCIGLLVSLLALAAIMLALGFCNKDLGQVEWSFEWLYTLPVSTRALYFVKLISSSMLNPIKWIFFFPFLIYIFLLSSCTWKNALLAFVATAYCLLLSGAITMLVEIVARRCLNYYNLKNLQALCTFFGVTALLSYIACSTSQPVADFYVRCMESVSGLILLQPFCVLLPLLSREASLGQIGVGLVLLVFWSLVALGSVFVCELVARDGLIKTSGRYQDLNRRTPSLTSPNYWPIGISGKEVLFLTRDRNILIQVFFIPLIVICFYLTANSRLLAITRNDFHHAAALAFCIIAYGLSSRAFQIVNYEKNALWILLMFPRSLISILVEKTMVWAVLSCLYVSVILVVLASLSHHIASSAWIDGFVVLYGISLYTFISAAMGLLANTGVGLQSGMIYVNRILIGMYVYSIYAPSYWSKSVQIFLTTLLAVALWQKIQTRLPYLFDTTAQRLSQFGIADGLISALAFFAVQGYTELVLTQIKSMPESTQSVAAHGTAAIVLAVLAIYSLRRHKMLNLWEHPGHISGQRGPMRGSISMTIIYGFICTGMAVLSTATYVNVISVIPNWKAWAKEAQRNVSFFDVRHGEMHLAFSMLLLPICIEIIFRGVVYRGFRSSMGPLFAILSSSILFALVFSPLSLIPAFGLGIATAFSLERTGFLGTPILVHVMYNICILFLGSEAFL